MRFGVYIVLVLLYFSMFACVSSGGQNENEMNANDSLAAKLPTMEKTRSLENEDVAKIVMDSSITTDYLMGKFVPEKHPDFRVIERKYADRAGRTLRKDTYAAFLKMYEAAKKDGIHFKIISATRPFNDQKRIWEGKWTGKRPTTGVKNITKSIPDAKQRALKILEYSSMPGSSRHHWGTDIDLNALTNDYFEKGKGLKEYEWLQANAAKFGFCQPYSPKGKDRPHGYNEEKWHWSYLPIAKKLSDQYRLRLQDKDINGFLGSESAVEIGIVEKYVLGINETCL